MIRAPPPPARRLVLKIYGVSVALILLVFLTLAAGRRLLRESDRPMGRLPIARYLVTQVAGFRRDPEALRREADRLMQELGMSLTLYAPDGHIVVSNTSPPFPSLLPREREQLQREPEGIFPMRGALASAVFENSKLVLYGVIAEGGGLAARAARRVAVLLGVLLLGLAVVAVLLARSLGAPLAHLAGVARAFGAGNLRIRSRLNRQDEFGDLSRAFDEMADRVTGLLQAEKELLANVSHELRTPLARIHVALDIAAEAPRFAPPTERVRESLRGIAEDLSDLERLLEDVLAAARLDLSGYPPSDSNPPLRLERVDAAKLLERAAARFRTAHAETPIEVAIEGTLPELEADPALLRRVIDNLLDNARKYSDPQAGVQVRAWQEGGGAVISVVDQGIGIEEGDVPHLFTPFFRTDRSRARKTGGVGLGLVLARRIVEAHGGTIAIESMPGVGTTARFTVPGVPGGGHAPPGRGSGFRA